MGFDFVLHRLGLRLASGVEGIKEPLRAVDGAPLSALLQCANARGAASKVAARHVNDVRLARHANGTLVGAVVVRLLGLGVVDLLHLLLGLVEDRHHRQRRRGRWEDSWARALVERALVGRLHVGGVHHDLEMCVIVDQVEEAVLDDRLDGRLAEKGLACGTLVVGRPEVLVDATALAGRDVVLGRPRVEGRCTVHARAAAANVDLDSDAETQGVGQEDDGVLQDRDVQILVEKVDVVVGLGRHGGLKARVQRLCHQELAAQHVDVAHADDVLCRVGQVHVRLQLRDKVAVGRQGTLDVIGVHEGGVRKLVDVLRRTYERLHDVGRLSDEAPVHHVQGIAGTLNNVQQIKGRDHGRRHGPDDR